MADPERPRERPPIFVCQVCGEAVTSAVDAIVSVSGVVHILCVDIELAAPLTPDERRRLIQICWDHEVAVCPVCIRKYRVNEMGADLFSGLYYHLCPFCRVDLAPSIRRHIAECAVILQNDPRWQAEARKVLARARETKKAS